jgi:hypothetical protein
MPASSRPPRAGITAVVLLLATVAPATAADWLVAAGPTRSDGAAIEVARATGRWELAVGFVSAQRVITLQDTCYAQPVGLPECVTESERSRQTVDPYGYLSAQRRFSWRPGRRLRPVVGLGAVASTDRNPYVSSPVTFSLSAGLRLGERFTLEWRHFSNAGIVEPNLGQDMLLLRGQW